MSEFAGFDLDRSTARAWGRWQSRLADHVAAMSGDDLLGVVADSALEDEDDGCAPYVQFCAWGEDLVRCEVSSNEHLAVDHLIEDDGVALLLELGFAAPTQAEEGSTNFYLDLERNHADRLAVMTVRAFRDVFGVEHPAFLSSDGLEDDAVAHGWSGAPGASGPGEPLVAGGAGGEAADEPLAVVPSDREHLKSLVDAALTPVFGQRPEHDEDDDIPVVAGSGLVWVRVLEDAPVVQLFAVLVAGISDPVRAAFEVTVLNRDVRFVKFVLVEDAVMAYHHLGALPFAPMQLRNAVSMMSEIVDQVDDDLAVRVGGHRALERVVEGVTDDVEDLDDDLETRLAEAGGGDPAGQVHDPAMLTLLQLDTDAPGSVDPDLAAHICELDRDLVLRLIVRSSAGETRWRQARDEAVLSGDPEGEADGCEHELRRAERITNLLRGALRVVVEQQAGRPAGTAYGMPEERRRRLRRRRQDRPHDPPHDRPLPGLDEGEQGLWGE